MVMAAEFPKPTGNPAMDAHNSAIVDVQAYLNGRAVGATSDAEKAYLLRLRADLNSLHLTLPSTEGDPETSATATAKD